MSMRQVIQPKLSVNGYGRRRVEREVGTRLDGKIQPGNPDARRFTQTGDLTGRQGIDHGSSSRDRLVYLTACLIGHDVEVQVKNGSIYSGIFHATNAEKDFGIILKMARLIKDGSLRGQKTISDSVGMVPSKTLIVPAKELVQVTAKDVCLTMDELANDLQQEREIMIDSSISQSRHVEIERELERWVPDEGVPLCPELDNIFDDPWNRSWDQFETNEALFGVKSTFDEELYTTKLDRGPQMRELEKEALRIAREIEGEETRDSHLAEERGKQNHEDIDFDEEARYSSVLRGLDDRENEDAFFNSRNVDTFGGPSTNRLFTDFRSLRSPAGAQVSYMDEAHASQYRSDSNNHAKQLASELVNESFSVVDGRGQNNDLSGQHGDDFIKNAVIDQLSGEEALLSNVDSDHMLASNVSDFVANSHSSPDERKDLILDKGVLSPDATAYAPVSSGLSKSEGKTDSSELSKGAVSGKKDPVPTSRDMNTRPGNSASSGSNVGNTASASSRPGLSPSSSVGSLSSEKSTLNPHAKEFKLNPNAKSFVPSQAPLRPTSPVSDSSFYFPASVPAAQNMHGLPLGFSMGPSFTAHQPVVLSPQGAPQMQTPQSFYHPNGPQYGQQMIVGHPRPVLYMHGYHPEMQYKGRDY